MSGRKINFNCGDTFGKLTVIKEVEPKYEKSGRKVRRILCKCECGNITEVDSRELTRTKRPVRSCGCLCVDAHTNPYWDERIYGIYKGMHDRCYKPQSINYKYYGAKGIKICDEWKNNYLAFYKWAINNGYNKNLSIDRIDYNKDYEPSNCRWATTIEQANNKSNNHIIEDKNGIKHTIGEWAIILNENRRTLQNRTRRQYSKYIEDLLLDKEQYYNKYGRKKKGNNDDRIIV